jgi:hypothetical protein
MMIEDLQKNIAIYDLSDGTPVLNCGTGGLDTDLVFVESSIDDEITTSKQKEMMEFIVKAVKAYNQNEH